MCSQNTQKSIESPIATQFIIAMNIIPYWHGRHMLPYLTDPSFFPI